MREGGGNCLKYLKRGWNRKEGRGNKDFKKGGQAGSRGGCLKKGGLEPPYKLWLLTVLKLVAHVYALLNILIFPWLSKLFSHRR